VDQQNLSPLGPFTSPLPLPILAPASRNAFTGALPTELTRLESLAELRVSRNRIDEPLHGALGSMGTLRLIDLSGNRIPGYIPPEFGNLSQLVSRFLFLFFNQV